MFHPAYGGWDLHTATVVAWSLSEKKLRSTCVCSDFFASPPFEHVEIFEPWNAQVLKHIALIYLRLDMAKQLKEIELPCFNEVLVPRSITIIDQADDWNLPHLQNKPRLCKWRSGLTISLCHQMLYASTASLKYLKMRIGAFAVAELTVRYWSLSFETHTLM